MLRSRLFMTGLLASVLALGAAGMPTAAEAYWRGGVVFGFPPIVVGPPVYYAPPPVVYAPPPVVYDPGPAVYDPGPAPAPGACHAGAFVCPLEQATPPGGACSCPTNTGRAYGHAR